MYTAAKEYEYGIYEYIDHLYSRNMDGHIQIIQKRKGEETLIIKSGKKGNIFEMAEKMTGYEDVAISPNTFYIPVRRSSNIRHFRALYVDLDLEGRNIKFSKTEAVYQAYMRAEAGRIPRPTMSVDSGRGVHLYWRIEDAPYQAWYTWQALEDYLYSQFRDLGAIGR